MEVCVNWRYQHIANLPNRKTPKVRAPLGTSKTTLCESITYVGVLFSTLCFDGTLYVCSIKFWPQYSIGCAKVHEHWNAYWHVFIKIQ